MLILLFEKHLIWSRSDGTGRTIYYYYYDQITWVVVAVAVIWIAWLLIRKHRRSRAQRRPPRGNNNRVPKQLVKIKDELSSKYLAAGLLNNLHAVGIGLGADGNYCVQLFVSDATKELWPGTDAKSLQASLSEIPLVVVQMPRANLTLTDADLRSYQDVTVGGVSGANINLARLNGTLGFFCRRHWDRYGTYVLSNAHVLVEAQNIPPRDTDQIVQPSPGEQEEGQEIAELYSYSPLKFADPTDPTFDPARANFIDAAIARLNYGQKFQPVLPDIGAVRGYVPLEEVAVGEPVRKVGRTTGYTEGRIFSVGVNLCLNYGSRSAYFMDQFLIEPSSPAYQRFINDGDSGSLVVEAGNYAIGLIFAGRSFTPPPGGNTNGPIINHYGIANPISKVLDAFNIELVRATELEGVAPIGPHE